MPTLPSFIEERFPEDISMGSTGGPQFLTNIITVGSGFEQRNVNWKDARAVYTVNHGVKTQQQIIKLISFFRMVRGKAIAFRYKDWLDYTAVGENIGTGDGVTTSFQLTKTYNFGVNGIDYIRKISKPVNGTVIIYVNGIQDNTVTIDYTTGLVTFNTPPASGAIITADFEFDVPCRFDTDQMSISIDTATISSWDQIQLVEVKL